MKSKDREVWRWFGAEDACGLALKAYYQAGREMVQVESEMGGPLGPEEGAMFALFFVESFIDHVGKLATSRDVACNHGCSLSGELWWPTSRLDNAADDGFYSRHNAKGLHLSDAGVNNHGG